MSDQKEYIVTLKNKNDLDEFYYDMETPGGNLFIPNRMVDLLNRRPISRNTHYNLTDAEAEQIKQDPRVLAVEKIPDHITLEPVWYDYSDQFYKGFSESAVYKNWGLLRCFEGQNRNNWGFDGDTTVAGSIDTNGLNGSGVDCVIIDGLFDPNHPEFAVNSDGSGGSRVNQINWLAYQGQTYNYGTYTGSTNAHGCHTAGTTAGNSQGWARSADIYNMSFLTSNFMDHVRQWHNSKTNGRPTITNNSYNWGASFYAQDVTSVYYRGQTYNGPFTATSIRQYGIPTSSNGYIYRIPAQNAAMDADMADAVADGIINIVAAGNSNFKIVPSGHQDYNNYLIYNGATYYYNRAPSPGINGIVVGATNIYVREERASFTNTGPRVDIFAPGVEIQSSRHADYSWGGGAPDPRNTNYYLEKIDGTSMATPQVCGLIACHLQNNTSWTQNDALNFIVNNASLNQLYDNGITEGVDTYSLFGASNRYLAWPGNNANPEPPPASDGYTFPIFVIGTRLSAGMIYPRKSIIFA